MAYILFLDESGQDLTHSPYEVIAGISIEDKSIWNLIREIHLLEENIFGRRYSNGHRELKARKILKSRHLDWPINYRPFLGRKEDG